MNAKERLNQILLFANLSGKALAEKIGVTSQSIYEIMAGRTANLSPRLRERILAKFPDISPLWLATGEGDMLRSASGVQQHIDIEQNNIHSDNTSSVGDDMMGAALAEIAAQRRLTEKAQAHIDRLLTIIDRLTDE